MSWSDLFYPGNPGKRAEVVRLCTKLNVLMEGNFRATNELIDVIHEVMPERTFQKIYILQQANIKTNIDIIIARISEIQRFLEEKSDLLKRMIEPTLYRKLVATNTSFQGKINLARQLTTATLTVIGSVTAVTVLGAIGEGKIFVSVISKLGKLKASAIASVAVSVLMLGIDMIASAILGAVERDRLDAAIGELERTMMDFEPASVDFTKNITKVAVFVEDLV